jgi:hypothetical protein
MRKIKINDHCEFPAVIDLRPFTKEGLEHAAAAAAATAGAATSTAPTSTPSTDTPNDEKMEKGKLTFCPTIVLIDLLHD